LTTIGFCFGALCSPLEGGWSGINLLLAEIFVKPSGLEIGINRSILVPSPAMALAYICFHPPLAKTMLALIEGRQPLNEAL